MAIAGMPILGFLKHKMRWHHARQRILAENVANADTPGFIARDLKAPTFKEALTVAPVSTRGTDLTHAGHISSKMQGTSKFKGPKTADWEMTPDGNAVVLEEQMMKVAQNQLDYQAVSTLYQKSIALIRTAIGRR